VLRRKPKADASGAAVVRLQRQVLQFVHVITMTQPGRLSACYRRVAVLCCVCANVRACVRAFVCVFLCRCSQCVRACVPVSLLAVRWFICVRVCDVLTALAVALLGSRDDRGVCGCRGVAMLSASRD
jgi:hypothetical protein